MNQKNIENIEGKPQQVTKTFLFPLQLPFVKKNWFGKTVVIIESLEWDYCAIGVVKEIVSIMKGLPFSTEDPEIALNLVDEHAHQLAYVIAKAYDNRMGFEPDQDLINHIVKYASAKELMQGFYLAYQSLGLEYFMAAIEIVRPTASILKTEDDI